MTMCPEGRGYIRSIPNYTKTHTGFFRQYILMDVLDDLWNFATSFVIDR